MTCRTSIGKTGSMMTERDKYARENRPTSAASLDRRTKIVHVLLSVVKEMGSFR